MGFCGKKFVAVSVDEMNDILDSIKYRYHIIYNHEVGYDEFGLKTTFNRNAWMNVKLTRFELTFKEGNIRQTFICKLDNSDCVIGKNGMEVYRLMQRYYKISEYGDPTISASPLLYSNPEHEGKRIYVYEYDLNSAYAAILLKDTFPNIDKPVAPGVVKKGEIGFSINYDIRHEGEFAPYIFKTMESPYKEYVRKYYDIKSTTKDKNTKATAKAMLNYGVGYWQRVNPILRAYVVNSCNEYMKSIIDENTVMANTDAIFSLVERPDLQLGNEIGQWKVEQGDFAYRGFNYQWGLNVPTYRGIPKSWFKKGWDILKDELPNNGNIWKFDIDKFRLVRVKHGTRR